MNNTVKSLLRFGAFVTAIVNTVLFLVVSFLVGLDFYSMKEVENILMVILVIAGITFTYFEYTKKD